MGLFGIFMLVWLCGAGDAAPWLYIHTYYFGLSSFFGAPTFARTALPLGA